MNGTHSLFHSDITDAGFHYLMSKLVQENLSTLQDTKGRTDSLVKANSHFQVSEKAKL